MSIEQYKTGTVFVRTASTFVYGTNTSWGGGTINENHKFKVGLDGYKSYTVATILSATKLQLSKKYVEASGQGVSYAITRSFTTHRSYARLHQGDSYAGDVIREQIVDKIDKDVGKIYNGTASLSGIRVVATSGLHYWDINVNATGEMVFSFNGVKKSYVATNTGSVIDSSMDQF